MNNPVNKTILLRGASNRKVSYLRPPERSVNQLFDVNAGSITNYQSAPSQTWHELKRCRKCHLTNRRLEALKLLKLLKLLKRLNKIWGLRRREDLKTEGQRQGKNSSDLQMTI